jgi:hypothetical protein
MRYGLRVVVTLCVLIVSSLKLPAQGTLDTEYHRVVAGAAAGIGVGVGLTIYLVHRSHTSLSGCVQSLDGSTRVLDGKQAWVLVSAPADLPVNHRVELRGKKSRAPSGERTFTVTKLAHDRGSCS